MSGHYQRDYFNKNVGKQIVEGYFYIHKKRYRRKVFRFQEIGLDKAGELINQTKKNRNEYIRRLQTKYNEIELDLQKKKKPVDQSKIKELFEQWFKSAEGNQISSVTINKFYKPVAKKYLKIVGNHSISQLSLAYLDKFKLGLAKEDLSKPYINIQLKTVKTFFNWAYKRELIDKVPEVQMLAEPKKMANVYTDDEIKKLFSHIKKLKEDTNDSLHERYYRAHLLFLYLTVGTGLRLQEVCFLEWGQIDFERQLLFSQSKRIQFEKDRKKWDIDLVIKEKADKKKLILPFTVDFLKSERNKAPDEKWLLDDGNQNPLFPESHALSTRFLRYQKDLKLNSKVKCVHGLRALYGTLADEAGLPLETIQDLMDHSDAKVTRIYTGRPQSRHKSAIEILNKRVLEIGI